MIRTILLGLTAAALTGCGVVYISPKVSPVDGKVRVVEITPDSLLRANKSTYQPKTLPAVFFQSADLGAAPNTPSGSGRTALLDPEFRPAPPQLQAPPEVGRPPYLIGPGDVLLLATPSAGNTVEELAGLLAAQSRRQGYTVQGDGMIAIPDVGRVMVGGLTLEEAEGNIFQSLVENQVTPSFSLEISEFRSQRVSVGGAVAQAVLVPMGLRPLLLEEAVIAAGGITAQDRTFTTIRIYRNGSLYQIPLEQYYTTPALQRTTLLDGDSIFVDTTYDLDRAQAYFQEQIALQDFRQSRRAQALSELNTEISRRRSIIQEQRSNFQTQMDLDTLDRDYVYLTGEVASQGRFVMPFNRKKVMLADVLYDNGGFSSSAANASQIYVMRGVADPAAFGAVTAWQLDASNATNLLLATRFELRPNDVIFIAEQPVTKWNRAVSLIIPNIFASAL